MQNHQRRTEDDVGDVVTIIRVQKCEECGAPVRMRPHKPSEFGPAILIPFNIDGTYHYCFQPKGCVKAR